MVIGHPHPWPGIVDCISGRRSRGIQGDGKDGLVAPRPNNDLKVRRQEQPLLNEGYKI